jgi:hypothetical protein
MTRWILVLAAAMAALFAAGAADAQQRAVIRAQVQTDTSFTDEFQQAMESGNYAAAAAMVREGRATGMATGRRQHTAATSGNAATSLAANMPPPDEADYTCNSGNCACAGASDCVAMAPICAEGTIGCNDYGCTCQEATE